MLEMNFVFLFISEYVMTLEGKVAMYKRGYHVLRRRCSSLVREMKTLKKEVKRLRRLVQAHEEISYLIFS